MNIPFRKPGGIVDPNLPLSPIYSPLPYVTNIPKDGYYQSSDMLPGGLSPPPGGFHPGEPGAPQTPNQPPMNPNQPPVNQSPIGPDRTSEPIPIRADQQTSTSKQVLNVVILTSPLWGIILLKQFKII
jgi:hypothetical protein